MKKVPTGLLLAEARYEHASPVDSPFRWWRRRDTVQSAPSSTPTQRTTSELVRTNQAHTLCEQTDVSFELLWGVPTEAYTSTVQLYGGRGGFHFYRGQKRYRWLRFISNRSISNQASLSGLS